MKITRWFLLPPVTRSPLSCHFGTLSSGCLTFTKRRNKRTGLQQLRTTLIHSSNPAAVMKTFLAIVVVAVSVAQVHSGLSDVLSNLPVPSFVANVATDIGKLSEMSKLEGPQLVKLFRETVKDCPWKKTDGELATTLKGNLARMAKKAVENPKIGLGLSCMSMLTQKEFEDQLTLNSDIPQNPNVSDASAPPAPHEEAAAGAPSRKKRQTAPTSVDWRTKGYVTPVKNQGQCGSCWTFSATGAMEGALFKKTGKLPNLSEQNLVDCVTGTPSDGCNGGWMTDAYDYVKRVGGINTGAAYPYKGVKGTCAFNKATSAGTVVSYAYSKQDNETDLELALRTQGPIAIAIDASKMQDYKSGIFTCSNCTAVNHGVLLVGYGVNTTATPPQNYWIVKNSWGTSWGEAGYIRIAKNQNNTCRIAYGGNYPIA